MSNLAALDLAVMAAYLVATLGLAVFATRARSEDAGGYFLANRSLPWYLIGFSYYASNMSGASFVGLIGASYSEGLVVFHYEWTAALVLALFAVFLIPVFLRNRIFTAPEYLGARYDVRTRRTYSLFTLVTLIFIDTAGALYAGAVVLSLAMPGLELWLACAGLALVTGLYTIAGGLKTVVVTDALQGSVIIVAAAALGLYGLHIAGGWEGLTQSLDASKFALVRPLDDPFLPWPGIIGVVILGFYYWTFNQYFVQRALGAKSVGDGRRGALFGGLLKLPNILLMIVPGLVAAALYPELESPDQAFPTLVLEVLPAGLRAVVLAALVAAIMSSLDSALNAASSLVTMDFVRPWRPSLTDRSVVRLGRAVTALVMAAAAIYAPFIASFGSLFEYFQSTLAYLVPSVVAIYLGGMSSRYFSRIAGFWALAVMLPAGLSLFLVKEVFGLWAEIGLPPLHFTYMAVLIFAATLVLMFACSIVRHDDELPIPADVLIVRSDFTTSAPQSLVQMLKDYRLQALALLAATAAILFAVS